MSKTTNTVAVTPASLSLTPGTPFPLPGISVPTAWAQGHSPGTPAAGAELLARQQPVIVLAIATFHSRDYSIEKLGIPRYVADPRFHVHGVATMHPDGRTEFRTDAEAAIRDLQRQYGDRLERALVAMHNARFGAFVLYWRHGVSMLNIVDTLCLSHLVNGPTQPAGLAELAALHGLPRKPSLEFSRGVRAPNAGQLARLARYACRDVEITRGLLDIYFPIALQTPQEIAIAAHTVRAFVERPFMVDLQAVDEGRALLVKHMDDLVAATGHDRVDISGNHSFMELMAAALARTGRTVPTKPGTNGDIGAFAKTDDGMVLLLGDADEAVRCLAMARLAVKSAPAQIKRFDFLKQSATACDGKCHAELVHHGAHAGRFPGGDRFRIPSISDQDCRSGEPDKKAAMLLRKAIQARPGLHLVAAEDSQIGCRVLAWLAAEPQLSSALSAGEDIYSSFAGQVFRRKVAIPAEDAPNFRLMKALRAVGRTAVLALGYGMDAEVFAARLKQSPDARQLFAEGVLTPESCEEVVAQYRRTFRAIPEFWDRCDTAFRDAVVGVESTVGGVGFLKAGGDVIIQLPSGRRMRYPKASLNTRDQRECGEADDDAFIPVRQRLEPAYTNMRTRSEPGLFGGKLAHDIASGIARDILVDAVLRLESQGWPVVAHYHDDIVCECPPERVEDCKAAMLAAWRAVPSWAPGLVLDAEAKSGRDFADIAQANTEQSCHTCAATRDPNREEARYQDPKPGRERRSARPVSMPIPEPSTPATRTGGTAVPRTTNTAETAPSAFPGELRQGLATRGCGAAGDIRSADPADIPGRHGAGRSMGGRLSEDTPNSARPRQHSQAKGLYGTNRSLPHLDVETLMAEMAALMPEATGWTAGRNCAPRLRCCAVVDSVPVWMYASRVRHAHFYRDTDGTLWVRQSQGELRLSIISPSCTGEAYGSLHWAFWQVQLRRGMLNPWSATRLDGATLALMGKWGGRDRQKRGAAFAALQIAFYGRATLSFREHQRLVGFLQDYTKWRRGIRLKERPRKIPLA